MDGKSGIAVHDLISYDLKDHDALYLRCVAGKKGLTRLLRLPEPNRPGLALEGFFDKFVEKRIQLCGQGEYAYVVELEKKRDLKQVERLLSKAIPCVVFTHDLHPSEAFINIAETYNCPVLITPLRTSDFSIRLTRVLSNVFAEHMTTHGVLVEVFGVGVLMTGESGIGKSEIALELIERGHRLVADDSVSIRCISDSNVLIGRSLQPHIGHNMEIRGLGIVNIPNLFGVGAVRTSKQVQLIVELENWQPSKEYERLGGTIKKKELLGVSIPHVQIPVRPGRNISIIVEVAAKNERLQSMGYNALVEMDKTAREWMKLSKKQRQHILHQYEIGSQEFDEV